MDTHTNKHLLTPIIDIQPTIILVNAVGEPLWDQEVKATALQMTKKINK